MEKMVSEMEARLETALAELGSEKNSVLRYDRSVKEVQAAIGELKDFLQAHPFAGMAEEIFYFRELAPRFYSRLFFFMKCYQVESFRQYASRAQLDEMLELELGGIEQFFLKHADICRYYYQQTSYWDEQLFTRRGRVNWPVDDIGIILDADFSLGSYWVSWIRANERYRGWLEGELVGLRRAEKASLAISRDVPDLVWTDGQTDLAELIYGIYLKGSFNDGKATIADITRWVSFHWKVELPHINNSWQEINRRKKEPFKYLEDMLRELRKKRDATND